MLGIRRQIKKLTAFTEISVIWMLGKVFGISFIVRYLRNPNPTITVRLLRFFGATVGNGTTIKRSLIIDNAYEDKNSTGDFCHLKFGDNCYIGDFVYFDLSNEIILADDVVVSGQASFVTHADCNRSKYLAEKFPRQCKPIQVEKGAWIGFRATILTGITIGEYAVIAANALVRKDVESKAVYAGLPARKIRDLDDLSEKRLHEGHNES